MTNLGTLKQVDQELKPVSTAGYKGMGKTLPGQIILKCGCLLGLPARSRQNNYHFFRSTRLPPNTLLTLAVKLFTGAHTLLPKTTSEPVACLVYSAIQPALG